MKTPRSCTVHDDAPRRDRARQRSWLELGAMMAVAAAAAVLTSGLAVGQVIEFGEGGELAFEGDVVTTPLNQVVLNLFLVGSLETCATVRYFTVDGTARAGEDFTPLDESFQWCPSLRDTFLAVTILPDTAAEGDETFEVAIQVSGGASAGNPDRVTVTIVDDDVAGPPSLRLELTDDGHLWGVDPLIPYRLVVRNEGGAASSAVMLTETVPVHTVFVPEESTPGWSCLPGSDEGAVCSLQVPPLAPGGAFEVGFAARVQPSAPEAFEVYNEATVGLASAEVQTAQRFGAGGRASATTLRLVACCLSLVFNASCDLLPERAGRGLFVPDTLYRLRDRVLHHKPGGRRINELFHQHVFDLAAASAANPAIYGMALDMIEEWQPVFDALVEGRADQVEVSGEQVAEVRRYVDALRDNTSSADFREFLEREDARMRPEEWVGLTAGAWLDRTNRLSCAPSEETLCLGAGRFRVEVAWQDFRGGTGRGRAVPLTDDTGTFWFFNEENIELVIKVLDGRALNGHFWVYYGALSNVQYTLTVTDTETGASRRYDNPANRFASVGDIEAFSANDAPGERADSLAVRVDAPVRRAPPSWAEPWFAGRQTGESELTSSGSGRGSCQIAPDALCLNDGRFRVQVAWVDFSGQSGNGIATPLTDDTGQFWFFNQENIEVVIKVLDGRALNGHFWVYYGALSNVEYELTVTDTATGLMRIYRNPSGEFASVGDTLALPGQ